MTDKSGRQWILASFQTRDNQGILYEGTPSTGGQPLGWAGVSSSQVRGRILRMEVEATSPVQTCLETAFS